MNKKNVFFYTLIGILCATIGIMIVLFPRVEVENEKNQETNFEPVIVSEQLSIDTRATDKERLDGISSFPGRRVYYAGLEDCTIGPETIVYLENMEENIDIYMKYSIYVNDKEVFQTNLIPPGEYVEWIPGEDLDAGKYTVYLKETPYYMDENGEYTTLTSPVNMVNITITN